MFLVSDIAEENGRALKLGAPGTWNALVHCRVSGLDLVISSVICRWSRSVRIRTAACHHTAP